MGAVVRDSGGIVFPVVFFLSRPCQVRATGRPRVISGSGGCGVRSRYRFMSIFPGIYGYYERKLGFVRKCLSFSYICAMQIFMVDKSIIADNRAKLYYHRILLSAITGFFCGTGIAHAISAC